MVKAVIFDFDGTLAYTLPDLTTGVNLMRAHYGYPPLTERDVLCFVNGSTRQYIERSMPADFPKEKIDEATEIYIAGYSKHYLDKTAPYDGVIEMLAKLRASGVRLAVMSNKDDISVQAMMQKLLPGAVDAVWGTVDGVPVKPDPARAWLIAEEFSLAPSDFAYVGDSDVDMKTARNAHMTPIGVSWGYRDEATLLSCGAKQVAHSTDELYEILKNIE